MLSGGIASLQRIVATSEAADCNLSSSGCGTGGILGEDGGFGGGRGGFGGG